jgi:hypothetical protein
MADSSDDEIHFNLNNNAMAQHERGHGDRVLTDSTDDEGRG